MWLAAIDPQLPPLVGAVATLAVALGLSERRRRQQAHRRANGGEIDRQAAETLLTQWKTVLEAMRARAEFAEGSARRCDEQLDELAEKLRILEWEKARRDWLDTRRPRKRSPRAQQDA